jgi:hypothetical protein
MERGIARLFGAVNVVPNIATKQSPPRRAVSASVLVGFSPSLTKKKKGGRKPCAQSLALEALMRVLLAMIVITNGLGAAVSRRPTPGMTAGGFGTLTTKIGSSSRSGLDPDLLRPATQAFHAVLLVGNDLSCEWEARVEAEMSDGGEHRFSRFSSGFELADDAAFVARIGDPGYVAAPRHSDAAFLPKRDLEFWRYTRRDRQRRAEPLHQAFNLVGVIDHPLMLPLLRVLAVHRLIRPRHL